MTVSPSDLNNLQRPDIQKKIIAHEKSIDGFLHENYTSEYDELPPYSFVEEMSAVQAEIIRRYEEAGWVITTLEPGRDGKRYETLLVFKAMP